jgi:fumarate reductase flavoprotein subunit
MEKVKQFSFEMPPAPIPETEVQENIDTDILVAGAGPAGLAAAVSAAESGARVVLLEKYYRIAAPGGPGAPFIDSKLQKAREKNQADSARTPSPSLQLGPGSGYPGVSPPMPGGGGPPPGVPVLPPDRASQLNKAEIIRGLYEVSEGRADNRLIRMWADQSGSVADWLIDMAKAAGVYVHVGKLSHMFTRTPDLQLHLNRTPVGTGEADDDRGGELVLLNMLADRARQLGVDIRLKTTALRLIRPDNQGRVTGLLSRLEKGRYLQCNTRHAVILCTGDYGRDEDMLEKYCPWAQGTPKLMLETVTGDGHKMGLWVGAAMEEAPHCPMLHFNSTNETPVVHFRPVGMINRGDFLYVNKVGERIANEAESHEVLANLVLRQPGKTFWQVFDERSVTEENRADVDNCLQSGAVLKADTLESLASRFGAKAEVFTATVARYNELVRLGQDLDFGKNPRQLGIGIKRPPYYVCESPPDLLCVMGGLKRDAEGQVLDQKNEVIPGLYAAGNIAGGFWGDTYPMHFLGGISRSHALVFGRMAGLHAVKSKNTWRK